ncbi:hypothetical protein BHM03_00007340 [Ensete ventricosum]|uniref:Uncharacterized protein n=1 Tax=Ensete ventricosum TaxID=4639 RepID=A0A426ZF08_ENSVE|nr:hypothetical protein B296_00010317 [Ensete ventricosum]RZR81158.1 hypothetical protein BHM03_00007340 [Ensete ventricosum]
MEGEVLHGIDELVGEDTRGTEREEADVQLLVVEGHKARHPKCATTVTGRSQTREANSKEEDELNVLLLKHTRGWKESEQKYWNSAST